MKKDKLDRLKKWFKIQPWVYSEVICPECGKAEIKYEFVGRVEDRMGYCIVWCNSCLVGINISRTKVPNEVPMLSFEQAEKGQCIDKPKIQFIT